MSPKVQFQTVTHSTTDMQLSAACHCSQSKFSSPSTFIWGKKKKKKLNLDGKIASVFLEIKNLNDSVASMSVITIRMVAAVRGIM